MVSEKLLTRCSATGELLLYDPRFRRKTVHCSGRQFDHHSCFATVLDEDLPLPIGYVSLIIKKVPLVN
jgi:hypothetical protein